MHTTIIKEARLKLHDGSIIFGPVTTEDGVEFLFRNTFNELDLYFYLKKDDESWYFSNGPSTPPPNDYINQIGVQIDSN